MDELKVVFYIAVAIAWVIYNNYRKFAEAARKRDPSRPVSPPERGERTDQAPEILPQRPFQAPQPVPAGTAKSRIPGKLKIPAPKTRVIKKNRPEPAFMNTGSQTEGGTLTPSKVVQFEEPEIATFQENPILAKLKSSGIRTGVVWSEILKRPYT
jgi:hypothetical protein